MRKERKYRPLIVPKKEKKRKDEQVDDIFYYFYFIFPLGENKLEKTTIDRKRSILVSFDSRTISPRGSNIIRISLWLLKRTKSEARN